MLQLQPGINYSLMQANTTISQVLDYIQRVNESSYLIFNPNLTTAYAYMDNASKIYQKSPGQAIQYAYLAKASAEAQYAAISMYKQDSLIVMLFFTAIFAAILYFYARPQKPKPVRKAHRSKARKR